MNSKIALFSLFFLPGFVACAQQIVEKFTAVNPVSYTDVVFVGIRDTVLVATPSGRIARINNKDLEEHVVARIDDEIYALAYNKPGAEIAAATLENGIVLIDAKNGKVIRKLPMPSTWTIALCYSGNYKWLAAVDQDAKAHVWEVQNEYKETVLPGSFPKGTIISIDSNNIAVIASFQKVSFWDLSRQELRRVWDVAPGKVADNDAQGNILILDFNQCTRYNALQKSADFVLQHPEWPLPDVDDSSKVYHIPYHMQLTAARFAGAHIYTAGIDRTICVWDLSTGKLEKTLTGHKGTISKLKVSGGGKQVVSVDLKGGIRFWEVE